MIDVVGEFLAAMASRGVHMDTAGGKHPIADGRMHRAPALNKKNRKNDHVWYVLHTDDPASGAFGDLQLGIEDTWTIKRPSAMTPAEKAALQERMRAAAEQRAAETKALNEAAAAAAKMMMAASGKADPAHPYLAKKGLAPFPGLRQLRETVTYTIEPGEKPRRAMAGTLIVPMFTPGGDLVGAQMISEDRKLFIRGTPKEGNYHSIGRAPEDGGLIILAEGYATGARLHDAIGALVVVAFDSGNLIPVAKAIRKKYPKARMLVAADNDRFTQVGSINNPGLTKAREAAEAVKALVAYPTFPDDDEKSTDFDDLAQKLGLAAVREAIDRVLNPQPEPERAPLHDEAPDGPGEYPTFEPQDIPDALETFGAPHFRCLGVDGTTYFFQPAHVAQVIELPSSAMKAAGLMRLAKLQWWESEFPAKNGVDWTAAINALVQACLLRGKFIPHNTVRGRGAWFEGSSAVFHAGDHLITDGRREAISAHRSRYVYDEGEALPVDIEAAADTKDARAFLDICRSLRWVNPLSGYMLAGWCVVAPVCGFLGWRPHIWVTGPAGSGKSTVIQNIIKAVLGSTANTVVGATTEAGIRSALRMDAMPVIFDESEPKDMSNQQRIRAILDLARVASSEGDGLILKGSANQRVQGFRARFMATFASINTQIEGYADETRFTQLALAAPEAETQEQRAANKAHYEKLVSDMVALLTPEFSHRLLGRTILNLKVLRQNVTVFTTAASLHLGTQRLGDQIGPMLAGAYLLNSTKAITVEEALEWVRGREWGDHSAKTAARDADRFVQRVTGHVVRHNTPEGGTWERTIGELIEIAAYDDDWETIGQDRQRNKRKFSAAASLARLGMKVWRDADGYNVDITTTHENFRNAILKGSEWAGTNLRNMMKGIPGAITAKGNRYFASGVNTPFVTVPINSLLGEREPGQDG